MAARGGLSSNPCPGGESALTKKRPIPGIGGGPFDLPVCQFPNYQTEGSQPGYLRMPSVSMTFL